MDNDTRKPRRLLLHACCGPCSLEPVRLLRERGIEPVIHFNNSNIAPDAEYDRRLSTIRDWCAAEEVEFIEDDYRPSDWHESAGRTGMSSTAEERRERCRLCYRMRFEESAAYASENGYDALGTTLSVSPYQYTEVIAEELHRACEKAGVDCFFEDYSPFYGEATKRSRAEGMYRQNYCGCLLSAAEAEAEREERRKIREEEKAAKAEARRAQEADLEKRRRERAAYDVRQARKRAILKSMRAKRSEDDSETDESRR